MSSSIPSWAVPGHPTWRIGHRGAAAHCPHNTLAGFRKAAELGADWVELDVQRTLDSQVAVIHDLTLRMPAGDLRVVRQTALAELRQVDLGGGERMPTLAEVFELCTQLHLNAYIELKDGVVAPLVIAAVAQAGFEKRCVVASFRPDWLADFRAADPGLPASILFGSKAIDGPHAAALAYACGASFVHPCWESDPHPSGLLTPQWLSAVRAAGLGIVAWHEERPTEIAALLALGVDGICSDRPELLQSSAV